MANDRAGGERSAEGSKSGEAPESRGRLPDRVGRAGHILARLALVFAGVYGLGQGFQLWARGPVLVHKEILVFSLTSYLAGFGCLALAAAYRPALHRMAGWVVVGVVMLTTFARGYNHLRYVSPEYGTDAVAFNHYAAELTLKGANPYSSSMSAASERFNVPRKYYTPDDTGRVVHQLSYPAHSFLVYVPFVGAGIENVNWVSLGAHLLAVLLLLLLSPVWLRPLAPLVFCFEPEFINFSVGGVTDILFVPLLIGAAHQWNRRKDVSAILWGVACGLKQGPWFLAPFMMVAIYHQTEGEGLGEMVKAQARYFGIAAAVFLIPNLPFMLTAPEAWLTGVFTPMGRKLVLYGSGLVNLTTSAGVALPRVAYTLLALSMWAALTAVYSLFYSRIRPLFWIFPGFILWLTPRAFHSYYMYWAPIFVVALGWELDRRGLGSEWGGGGEPEGGGEENGAGGAEEERRPKEEEEGKERRGEDRRPKEEEEGKERRGEDERPKEEEEGKERRGEDRRPKEEEEEEEEGEGKAGGRKESRFEPEERVRAAGAWHAALSFLRKPRGAAVLLALPLVVFGAAAVFAAAGSPRLETTIVEASDPDGSGVIRRVEVEVRNVSDRKAEPRFAMVWRGNNLFFWDPLAKERKIPPGQTRTFVLTPDNPTEAPPLEEPFRLRVYDPGSSRFYLTPISGPHPRSALVLNKHFRHWDDVSHQPVRWDRSPPAVWGLGDVELKRSGDREAVCLSAHQRGRRDWARTTLEQEVVSEAKTLSFVYRSESGPSGEREPTQLVGVEVELPRGEIAVFSPAPSSPVPVSYPAGHHTFFHLPYEQGEWKRYRIDMTSLARLAGYSSLPGYVVRLVTSRHRKLPGSVSACFEEVTASERVHLNALSVRRMGPLDNETMSSWVEQPTRPAGWRLERPLAGATGAEASPNGPVGAALSMRRQPEGPGWARLALTQISLQSIRKLRVEVCTKSVTQSIEEPRLLAGVELIDQGETHVWTLCEGRERARSTRGKVTVHCVPAGDRPTGRCVDIEPDMSGVRGDRVQVGLLLNVHRTRPGRHEVRFGPLRVRRR
jgi:hypothetical protein